MKIENVIASGLTNSLREEMEYLTEDVGYGYLEAFEHLISMCEEGRLSFTEITPLRKIQIKLGMYVPVTEEELKSITVLSGKKYDFQMKGIKYKFSKGIQEL